jgi:hypothetical protein
MAGVVIENSPTSGGFLAFATDNATRRMSDTMSLQDEPHIRIASPELAAWLEAQGTDRWWNVDGDPILTSRLNFPCPGDELAAELRRINRTLLVQDRRKPPSARGERIVAQDLDAFVTRQGDNIQVNGTKPLWANNRMFFLCWEDSGDEWLLVEDEETTESSRADAEIAQGTRK